MKEEEWKLYIFCLFLSLPFISYGQDTISVALPERVQDIIQVDSAFLPDSVIQTDLILHTDTVVLIDSEFLPDSIIQPEGKEVFIPLALLDSTTSITFWNITRRTGEMHTVIPDTFLTDYFNRTNPDGAGISVAHLGNLGLPMESRIFFDRTDRSQFMFADPFWAYAKEPDNFNFVNTKIPYSTVSYQRAGSRANLEERLQTTLALNYGKELNFGFDLEYLYARGFYNSQGTKHLEWVFFTNYVSDRHQLHVFINPFNYTNGENGGIANDGWISRPDTMGNMSLSSKELPTNLQRTWNKVKGNKYYLNYHYNLGFKRKTGEKDEDDYEKVRFVPVSSIIYTFDYNNYNKRFYTDDPTNLDLFFNEVDHLNSSRKNKTTNDSTSHYSVSNTLALSLREGFSDWAKFDLTAFISHTARGFTLMDTIPSIENDSLHFESYKKTQNTVYLGGELAKKTGKTLTYNGQASFGILGYNLGDMNLSGKIETKIPLFNRITSVFANAYIKNLSPTFYENNYRSKYYWWKNDFGKVRKVYLGGGIDLPYTNTNLSVGVENLDNYIYFDETGYPQQHDGNIQIVAATLKQNFKLGILNWNNQLVYQKSSKEDIIPLPDLALYSSLFIEFKVAKVLTVQMGGNVHYWTEYYAPIYNPATQQFTLQTTNEKERVKTGNYPLINGFINCHLKQARFFIEYYNASSAMISPTNYFSSPHYPVNPTVVKLGISVHFIN